MLLLPTGTAVDEETVARVCGFVRFAVEHGPEIAARLAPAVPPTEAELRAAGVTGVEGASPAVRSGSQVVENRGVSVPRDSTDSQREAAVFRNLVTTLLPRSLTVKQVAERLTVSPSTVYELCARGELRHVRVRNAVRVPEGWLAEFVAGARAGDR